MENEFMLLEVTVRDKINELVASCPSNLQSIYEHAVQLLAAVESQCHVIKETIENDGPCSDNFMREIISEQGLSSGAPYGSSSNSSAISFSSPPNTGKPPEENAKGRQVPDGEQGNSSQQSQAPQEPHCSPLSPNVTGSQLPQHADAHRESNDGHLVNSNELNIPADKQTWAGDTQKPTKPPNPVKRSAEHWKKTIRKKKKSTALGQLPIVTNCKFSTAEIYEQLQDHCRNPDISWLLTRLFFAIASPEAFSQAKDAYHCLQSGNIQIHLSRTSTVSDHMTYLDRLASSFTACHIIERSILVQLVNRRDELVQKFKAEPDRRMRKTTEAKSQSRLQRADGLALSIMMEEAFPILKKGADDYNQRLTTLRNRLSKGRNWHSLATRFGNGALALAPIDGEFQIHDRAIQRLGGPDFNLFLEVLDDRRGYFIRTCSAHIDRLLNLCYEPGPTETCSLEEVDEYLVKRISYDSPDLVEFLKIK